MTMLALACKRPAASGPAKVAGHSVDCAAVRPQPHPDLVAWDAESRALLGRLRRQGVVAVRYEADGCDVSLEVLTSCVGPKNRYVYSSIKSGGTHLARDPSEVYERWPLGAENVTPRLEGGRAVRVDFTIAGSVGLPEGTNITEYDLVGPDCKRATHVVSAIYLGAFAMVAGDARALEAATDLLATPGGPGATPIAREGDAAICTRAQAEGVELPGCAAPVRVALLPLDGSAPPSRCTAGYVYDGSRCVPADEAGDQAACSTWGAGEAGCSRPTTGDSSQATQVVFEQAAVERVVRQRGQSVKRACWETQTDSLRRIEVSVTIRVGTDGRVVQSDATLEDAEGPKDVANVVARCIANEVRTWRFPAPETEQVVSVPFHLIRQ
jgi:hypothetical protein